MPLASYAPPNPQQVVLTRDYLTMSAGGYGRVEEYSTQPFLKELARKGPSRWSGDDLETLDRLIRVHSSDHALRFTRAEVSIRLGQMDRYVSLLQRSRIYTGESAKMDRFEELSQYVITKNKTWTDRFSNLSGFFVHMLRAKSAYERREGNFWARSDLEAALKIRPKDIACRMMYPATLLSGVIYSSNYPPDFWQKARPKNELAYKLASSYLSQYKASSLYAAAAQACERMGKPKQAIPYWRALIAMNEPGTIGQKRRELAISELAKLTRKLPKS